MHPEIVFWNNNRCQLLARWYYEKGRWHLKFEGDRPFEIGYQYMAAFWFMARYGQAQLDKITGFCKMEPLPLAKSG